VTTPTYGAGEGVSWVDVAASAAGIFAQMQTIGQQAAGGLAQGMQASLPSALTPVVSSAMRGAVESAGFAAALEQKFGSEVVQAFGRVGPAIREAAQRELSQAVTMAGQGMVLPASVGEGMARSLAGQMGTSLRGALGKEVEGAVGAVDLSAVGERAGSAVGTGFSRGVGSIRDTLTRLTESGALGEAQARAQAEAAGQRLGEALAGGLGSNLRETFKAQIVASVREQLGPELIDSFARIGTYGASALTEALGLEAVAAEARVQAAGARLGSALSTGLKQTLEATSGTDWFGLKQLEIAFAEAAGIATRALDEIAAAEAAAAAQAEGFNARIRAMFTGTLGPVAGTAEAEAEALETGRRVGMAIRAGFRETLAEGGAELSDLLKLQQLEAAFEQAAAVATEALGEIEMAERAATMEQIKAVGAGANLTETFKRLASAELEAAEAGGALKAAFGGEVQALDEMSAAAMRLQETLSGAVLRPDALAEAAGIGELKEELTAVIPQVGELWNKLTGVGATVGELFVPGSAREMVETAREAAAQVDAMREAMTLAAARERMTQAQIAVTAQLAAAEEAEAAAAKAAMVSKIQAARNWLAIQEDVKAAWAAQTAAQREAGEEAEIAARMKAARDTVGFQQAVAAWREGQEVASRMQAARDAVAGQLAAAEGLRAQMLGTLGKLAEAFLPKGWVPGFKLVMDQLAGTATEGLARIAAEGGPAAAASAAKIAAAFKAGGIAAAIIGVMRVIEDAMKRTFAFINDEWGKFGKVGKDAAEALMSGFENVIEGKMPDVKGAMQVGLDGVQQAFDLPINAINQGIDFTVGHIPILGGMIKTMASEVQTVLDGLFTAIKEYTSIAGEFGQALLDVGNKWQEAARTISGQTLGVENLENYVGIVREIAASGDLVHFKDVAEVVGELGQRLMPLNNGMGLTRDEVGELASTLAEANELLGDTKINVDNMTAAFNSFNVKGEGTNQMLVEFVNMARMTGADINELFKDAEIVSAPLQTMGLNLRDTGMYMALLNQHLGRQAMGKFTYTLADLPVKLNEAGMSVEDLVAGIQSYLKMGDDPKWEQMAVALAKPFVFGAQGAEKLVSSIKQGIVPTHEAMDAAFQEHALDLTKPFDDALEKTRKFQDVLEQVSNQVMAALAPLGIGLVEKLNGIGDKVVTWLHTHQAEVTAFVGNIGEHLLDWGAKIAHFLGAMLKDMAGFVEEFKDLSVAALETLNREVMRWTAFATQLPKGTSAFTDALRGLHEASVQASHGLEAIKNVRIDTVMDIAGDGVDALGNSLKGLEGPLAKLISDSKGAAAVHAALQAEFAKPLMDEQNNPVKDASGNIVMDAKKIQDALGGSLQEGMTIDPATIDQVRSQLHKLDIDIDVDPATNKIKGFTAATQREMDDLQGVLSEMYKPENFPKVTRDVEFKVLPLTKEEQNKRFMVDKLGVPEELAGDNGIDIGIGFNFKGTFWDKLPEDQKKALKAMFGDDIGGGAGPSGPPSWTLPAGSPERAAAEKSEAAAAQQKADQNKEDARQARQDARDTTSTGIGAGGFFGTQGPLIGMASANISDAISQMVERALDHVFGGHTINPFGGKFQLGGTVSGPGGTDQVMIRATAGEKVMNLGASGRFGPLLDWMNLQGFAAGGTVLDQAGIPASMQSGIGAGGAIALPAGINVVTPPPMDENETMTRAGIPDKLQDQVQVGGVNQPGVAIPTGMSIKDEARKSPAETMTAVGIPDKFQGSDGLAIDVKLNLVNGPPLPGGDTGDTGDTSLSPPGSGPVQDQVHQAMAGGGMIGMAGGGMVGMREGGFPDSEWPALNSLVAHESSWQPGIRNPSSGAYGLFQFLGHEHDKYGQMGGYSPNPYQQAKAGVQYIKDRYGTPTNAWNMWQSRSPHWYSGGGAVGFQSGGETPWWERHAHTGPHGPGHHVPGEPWEEEFEEPVPFATGGGVRSALTTHASHPPTAAGISSKSVLRHMQTGGSAGQTAPTKKDLLAGFLQGFLGELGIKLPESSGGGEDGHKTFWDRLLGRNDDGRMGMAAGGHITGVHWPGRDSVPMSVPPGTFIMNRHRSIQYKDILDRMLGSGYAGGGMIPIITEPGERVIPPGTAPAGFLHAMNQGQLQRRVMGGDAAHQGGANTGVLQVIYNPPGTSEYYGEAAGFGQVGPGTSQPQYYAGNWSGHHGHVHTSFETGPHGEPYGMPIGTNLPGGQEHPEFASAGFGWILQLGRQYGLYASTYPGHQEHGGKNHGLDWWPMGKADMSGMSYTPQERDRLRSFASAMMSAGNAGPAWSTGLTAGTPSYGGYAGSSTYASSTAASSARYANMRAAVKAALPPWLYEALGLQQGGVAGMQTGGPVIVPSPSGMLGGDGPDTTTTTSDDTTGDTTVLAVRTLFSGGKGKGKDNPYKPPTVPAPLGPFAPSPTTQQASWMERLRAGPDVAPGTPGTATTPFGTFILPTSQNNYMQLTQDEAREAFNYLVEQENAQKRYAEASDKASIALTNQATQTSRVATDQIAYDKAYTDTIGKETDVHEQNKLIAFAMQNKTSALYLAYEELTKAKKAEKDASDKVTTSQDGLSTAYNDREKAMLAKVPGEDESGKGGVTPDENAAAMGSGLVKGIAQEFGFGDVFAKPPWEWGIWKLFAGGASVALQLANFMGEHKKEHDAAKAAESGGFPTGTPASGMGIGPPPGPVAGAPSTTAGAPGAGGVTGDQAQTGTDARNRSIYPTSAGEPDVPDALGGYAEPHGQTSTDSSGWHWIVDKKGVGRWYPPGNEGPNAPGAAASSGDKGGLVLGDVGETPALGGRKIDPATQRWNALGGGKYNVVDINTNKPVDDKVYDQNTNTQVSGAGAPGAPGAPGAAPAAPPPPAAPGTPPGAPPGTPVTSGGFPSLTAPITGSAGKAAPFARGSGQLAKFSNFGGDGGSAGSVGDAGYVPTYGRQPSDASNVAGQMQQGGGGGGLQDTLMNLLLNASAPAVKNAVNMTVNNHGVMAPPDVSKTVQTSYNSGVRWNPSMAPVV
jgi:hypothetical protein